MNWACCNDTKGWAGNCAQPLPGNPALGEPFQAPAPGELLQYFSIPAAGYVQQTSSPSSPSATGPSQSTDSSATSGNSLSAGASAGIGVGVGLGTSMVVIGAGLWVLRRRHRKHVPEQNKGLEQQRQSGDKAVIHQETSRGCVGHQELDNVIRPRELQA
ncbi:hypothetical protein PG993_009121 [Apiospora rasikravindrae]|uniref:Uncharacterized protein n=1 Tax=Apiospora rasikravindrae TaxID=990691 RepID=A0ABR1SIH0_9PEZI